MLISELKRLEEAVRRVLARGGRIVVVCIGNSLRGDDAFGPLVYEFLREEGVNSVINAEHAPENALGLLLREKPSLLILVDAVKGRGRAGELIVTRLSEASSPPPLTTHSVPLDLLVRAVDLDPARVILVGVYASNFEFGVKPSVKVVKAAKLVAELLARVMATSLA